MFLAIICLIICVEYFNYRPDVVDLDTEETKCFQLLSNTKTNLNWICEKETLKFDPTWIQTRFTDKDKMEMSATGRRIFLEDDVQPRSDSENKTYLIHIWGMTEKFDLRFVYSFSSKYTDPFGPTCSVHNCRVSYNSSEYENVSR